MTQDADPDRWARLRFAIIGPLLAAPPPQGELGKALEGLSRQPWRHPVNGTTVRFSAATLKRWYYDETAETLVHEFCQALQRRGLPRSLMTDNGASMQAGEFQAGLHALRILHEPTLPYSPYRNVKQETLWATIEGRLMAMLHKP